MDTTQYVKWPRELRADSSQKRKTLFAVGYDGTSNPESKSGAARLVGCMPDEQARWAFFFAFWLYQGRTPEDAFQIAIGRLDPHPPKAKKKS
jgi:hypothetical protein